MKRSQNRRVGERADARFSFPADPLFEATTDSDFFHRGNAKQQQKARQVCRQVYRTLCVALPSSADDALQSLTVVAVDPAPDASHLLVTLSLGDDRPPAEIYERLARAAGWLRGEVVRDLVRKRAPELSFRLLPRREAR